MTPRGRPPRPYLDPHLSRRAEDDTRPHCTFDDHQRLVNIYTRYRLLLAAYRLDGRSSCRDLALKATGAAYGLSADRVTDLFRREWRTLPKEWRDLVPDLKAARAIVQQYEASGKRLPR